VKRLNLITEQLAGLDFNTADHCHTLAGGQPILAFDMYEHSYHIDHGAKTATYVDTYMNAIPWHNTDTLFARYANSP
jgi:superoxide dismutase